VDQGAALLAVRQQLDRQLGRPGLLQDQVSSFNLVIVLVRCCLVQSTGVTTRVSSRSGYEAPSRLLTSYRLLLHALQGFAGTHPGQISQQLDRQLGRPGLLQDQVRLTDASPKITFKAALVLIVSGLVTVLVQMLSGLVNRAGCAPTGGLVGDQGVFKIRCD